MDEERMDDRTSDYQEFKGNFFLVYQEQLRDVRVENPIVQIPETVRIIRRESFLNEHLEHKMKVLLVPSSVKRIDRLTFNGLESLTYVEILPGLKKLEPGTFRNCFSLKKVILPETLVYIEDRAFENCMELTEVEGASRYLEVSADAFLGCASLKDERIEECVRAAMRKIREEEEQNKPVRVPLKFPVRMEDTAEGKEEPLEKEAKAEAAAMAIVVEAGNMETKAAEEDNRRQEAAQAQVGVELELSSEIADTRFCIQHDVLIKCETGSNHIVIPEGVKSLGERVFYGQQHIKEIEFPQSLTDFGREALEGTGWLTGQRREKSFVAVNGVLISALHDSMVLEAVIPDGIWKIASGAFSGNTVNRIVVPETVREIAERAFYKINVMEIEFRCSGELLLHHPVVSDCPELKELLIFDKKDRIDAGFSENCPMLHRVCLKGTGTVVHKEAFPDNVRIWIL